MEYHNIFCLLGADAICKIGFVYEGGFGLICRDSGSALIIWLLGADTICKIGFIYEGGFGLIYKDSRRILIILRTWG